MLLNEIINEVGMTKRAVKYYEEKGLLSVDKDMKPHLRILKILTKVIIVF